MPNSRVRPADHYPWELDHQFEDKQNNILDCGRQDCTIGSYLVETSESGAQCYAPACTTCKFNGSLGDVFNPEEPRFVPNAPEDFKRAAARILINGTNTPIDTIRTGRPDTAAMIEEYATTDNPVD